MSMGIPKKVASLFKGEGIDVTIYDGVDPNPKIVHVEEGLALYQKKNCDIIIAVGGGSPIDCAKGIGLLATNGGSIKDYEGVNKSQRSMAPLIAVNTTAGTGSEVTCFDIITDTEHKVKMAIVDIGM